MSDVNVDEVLYGILTDPEQPDVYHEWLVIENGVARCRCGEKTAFQLGDRRLENFARAHIDCSEE